MRLAARANLAPALELTVLTAVALVGACKPYEDAPPPSLIRNNLEYPVHLALRGREACSNASGNLAQGQALAIECDIRDLDTIVISSERSDDCVVPNSSLNGIIKMEKSSPLIDEENMQVIYVSELLSDACEN